MNSTCPKGHLSTDPDYCSDCGMRMDAPAPAASSTASGENTSPPTSGSEICPDCATPRVGGSRFCEVCRYDFAASQAATPSTTTPVTTSMNATSTNTPISPDQTPAVTAPTSTSASATSSSGDLNGSVILPENINVVVITDSTLVTEPNPATPCPVNAPERVFPLDLVENLVGRRSDSKGIYPEVEIADPGVSHRHLKLVRQDYGSFAALELGSANGTEYNGTALIAGVAVPVKVGDELLLGLWTRLSLRARHS